jgi:hypothetical protein
MRRGDGKRQQGVDDGLDHTERLLKKKMFRHWSFGTHQGARPDPYVVTFPLASYSM